MLQRVRWSSVPDDLKSMIEDQDYPCVGAKSALANGQIECIEASDIRYPDDDAAIVAAVQDFAGRHGEAAMFVSLAVLFEGPVGLDELGFELALWTRLQTMHEIDRRDFGWDESVSADPKSPAFSMSIGGCGFYVIGLHPNSSRIARRLSRPAMIFNLHRQFEDLRNDGRFAQIRETIVTRDIEQQGTENPMLADHGEASEARQYSGREVGKDWACPFRPLPHDPN